MISIRCLFVLNERAPEPVFTCPQPFQMQDVCLISRWICLALLAAGWWCSITEGAIPADEFLASLKPQGDINDFAGVLQPAERQALEQRCRELRERTGAQLAVVIVRSLQGGQIDDFAVRLFQRWGIGQAGQNNGVLLFVALEDRKARIEVGYGLESVLPDVLAGRILREQLFPAFRQQQYAQGLTATVERLAEIIERNEPAPPVESPAAPTLPAVLFFTTLMIPWVSVPSFLSGASLREGNLLSALFLAMFPGFGYLLAVASGMPWLVLLLMLICSGGAALLGFWASEHLPRPRGGGGSPLFWDWGGPPWTGGSSWSGGGFSGGGGWGGFGGGSSGGGGASGSW